jgi:phage shock protein A
MRLRRRREPIPPAVPAVRMERAIVALASHAAQLSDRIDRLERRIEDAEDTAFAALAPGGLETLAQKVEDLTHEAVAAEEVLELRLHSVRLSRELTRLTTELRAGIDRLSVATIDHDERTRRLEAMASAVLDLTEDDDWAASA